MSGNDSGIVEVERLGGFAGFGLPGSQLRSRGQVDSTRLSAVDRRAVEALFAGPAPAPNRITDGFSYRLTRRSGGSPQSLEVPEHLVPQVLRDCVQDELA